MKRALALASMLANAAAIGGSASGKPAARTCPASPVDGEQVHAGVITGGIDPYTDVVDGRFRLHVGAYRDVPSGTFQKILWWVPSDRKGIGGRFRRPGPDAPDQHVDASNLKPPAEGCWRLTFKNGRLTGSLVVLVHDG